MAYIDRLHAAIARTKTPALVGLDPRYERLPEEIRKRAETVAGDVLTRKASAFQEFCERLIGVVAPLVPAVKPQAAFFEELGPAGMSALAGVIKSARNAGLIVILDGKRSDIGSTAQAYARGWLAGEDGAAAAWQADALTVNPYLGDDTLTPFVEQCDARGAGLYVLVRTSNPGAKTWQDRRTEGQTLYEAVGATVESLAAARKTESGYGSIGAVIGATWPQELAELRERMPHTPLLIPGYGSQGGGAADVRGAFDSSGFGALINNSRGINFAYERPEFRAKYPANRWEQAVAAATQEMIENLAAETSAGALR